MQTIKYIFGSIGGIIVVAAVLVGLFFGGWMIREYSVNRSAEIRRDQYEVQETARDEVVRQAALIKAVDVQLTNPTLTDDQRAALQGQRTAMTTQLCNVASSITGGISVIVDNAVYEYCG